MASPQKVSILTNSARIEVVKYLGTPVSDALLFQGSGIFPAINKGKRT